MANTATQLKRESRSLGKEERKIRETNTVTATMNLAVPVDGGRADKDAAIGIGQAGYCQSLPAQRAELRAPYQQSFHVSAAF